MDLNVPAEMQTTPIPMKKVRRRAPKKTASEQSPTVPDVLLPSGIPDFNSYVASEVTQPAKKSAKERAPPKPSVKMAGTATRRPKTTAFQGIGSLLTALCSASTAVPPENASVPVVYAKEKCNQEGAVQSVEDPHNGSEVSKDGGNSDDSKPKPPVRKETRPKEKRDSRKQWGMSIKRGCLAQFTVKQLRRLPHISEICIIQARHVNSDGLVVHGGLKGGDRSAFSAHLSPLMKAFIDDCLHRHDTIPQIMKKHVQFLKKWKADGKTITRDLLITAKDVRNISGKLASETYMLHPNDAQSVRMWVHKNQDKVFYYTETNLAKPVDVLGSLDGKNMPFTVGIQTEWQREMMAKYGNGGAVSVDATFGTNEKKVSGTNPELTLHPSL